MQQDTARDLRIAETPPTTPAEGEIELRKTEEQLSERVRNANELLNACRFRLEEAQRQYEAARVGFNRTEDAMNSLRGEDSSVNIPSKIDTTVGHGR